MKFARLRTLLRRKRPAATPRPNPNAAIRPNRIYEVLCARDC
jgi:hypothetical protein